MDPACFKIDPVRCIIKNYISKKDYEKLKSLGKIDEEDQSINEYDFFKLKNSTKIYLEIIENFLLVINQP